MSVDTELMVSDEFTGLDIQLCLKTILGESFSVSQITFPGGDRCCFLQMKGSDINRQMFVSEKATVNGLKCTYLSMGCDEWSVGLFRKIAERLGGFLCENDCKNQYSGYQNRFTGDLNFLLRQYQLSGGNHNNYEDFAEYCKKWKP